ncbi:MAG: hypothetical protein P0Y50_12575 [Candidatus Brevundimonas colombiensis]|uniref:Uncharacterized protein n=1 Tax=Candidatus Brevundimonas colombiensis TaxID=3121376 RepID=A0AAJ6BL98_9CAUL|nr:hypothetical protein [Brevundimonas sp.]WEK39366.1 MAG: hypothetical protein P0Y50_12575 [Brevundimonas sp.]
MARSILTIVSNRPALVAAAMLCLAAIPIAASCTPEPAPYASRAAIER